MFFSKVTLTNKQKSPWQGCWPQKSGLGMHQNQHFQQQPMKKEKNPCQECTTQKSGLGMHQNLHFQQKPMKNITNLKINPRSTIENFSLFLSSFGTTLIWYHPDLVPPWFWYHPDFGTTLILVPPWFYYHPDFGTTLILVEKRCENHKKSVFPKSQEKVPTNRAEAMTP